MRPPYALVPTAGAVRPAGHWGPARRPAFIGSTPVVRGGGNPGTYTDPMAVLHAAGAPLTTSGYTLLIADDADQVAAAQRLRHDVFAAELGATLRPATAGLRRRRLRRATATT